MLISRGVLLSFVMAVSLDWYYFWRPGYYSYSKTTQILIFFAFISLFILVGMLSTKRVRSTVDISDRELLSIKKVLWFFFLSISLGMIAGSFPYYAFDPALLPRRQSSTLQSFPLVPLHIVFGVFWLLSGFLQLTPKVLQNRRLHRLNGYFYFIMCAGSLVSLILINLKLQHKSPFGPSPFTQITYTFVALSLGFVFLKRGDLQNHRGWMIRSLSMGLLMSLDRFHLSVIHILEITEVDFVLVKYALWLGTELVILNYLEFDLLKFKSTVSKISIKLLVAIICVSAFALTFNFEYRLLK